jgi:TolB-like protein
MGQVAGLFALSLFGPFRLTGPNGKRIEIASKKGMALIAMLAMGKEGERTREWLQEKLWGSRQQTQAQSSLRRELSNLRKLLNTGLTPLLICAHGRVRLDLEHLDVDALTPNGTGRPAAQAPTDGEFLEGIDIPNEEGFEEWLREQRSALREHVRSSSEPRRSGNGPTAVTPLHAGTQLQVTVAAEESPVAQAFATGPSLAVLRVANLTGNPDDAYFAEGFRQELINALSRLRWLTVIAGDSEGTRSTASGNDVTALGAKYLIDGTLRTADDLMLIDVKLYEAARTQIVWSKRLEIARPLVTTALDECLNEVVAHLGSKIDRGEQLRARERPSSSATVTDLVWRGRWHLNRLKRADSDKAQELFSRALAIDPHSPEALINATHALAWAIWSGRQPPHRVHEFRHLAQQSMQADPSDGRAFWLAGTAETWLRHMQPALDLLFQAVELTPSLAIAYAQIGCTLNLCRKPDEAGQHLQLARRLSPFDVHLFFVLGELAMMSSLLKRYEDALAYADLSIARRQQYWYAHMIKVDALVRLGERERASMALEELLALKPRFSRSYIDWIPFEDRSLNKLFAESILSVSRAHSAA